MENRDFDKKIKDALGNFEVDYNAPDWDAMQKRLELEDIMESSEMEDVYMDTVVYGNLKNMEVPYEPADWNKMEARLDKAFAYRKYIVYRYKLAEIGLMLLFIFTLVQLWPAKKQQATVSSPVIAQEQFGLSTNAEQFETATLDEVNSKSISEAGTISKVVTEADLADHSNKNSGQDDILTHSIFASSKNTNTNNSFSSSLSGNTSTDIINNNTITNQAEPAILSSQSVITSDQFVSILHTFDNAAATGFELPAVKAEALPSLRNKIYAGKFLALPELQVLDFDTDQSISYDCKLCQIGKNITAIKVGMFSTSDLNMITTPFDEELGEGKYGRTYAFGYGGGLSIGLDFGNRWTIQTGLIYSAKSYEPFSVVEGEVYGTFDTRYITESFTKFEFDVLQIPIELQYQINRSSKWQIYGLAGASINTIIQANYDRDVETSDDFGFRSGNTGLGGSPSVQDLRQQESEFFSNDELIKGFFESGDFSRNTFISLNAGVGLERAFSARWSFFLEPSFRYYLGSFSRLDLGPNHDRINTGSLRLGAKVNLK